MEELESAQRVINDHIEPDLSIGLSIDEGQSTSAAVVQWTITDALESRFVFPAAIFRSDGGDVPISRWINTLPLIARFIRSKEMLPGKVLLSLEDRGASSGLAYCDNNLDRLLIPDPSFIGSLGYADVRTFFQSNFIPWTERRRIAFWRGATSGRPDPRELGWQGLPRVILCKISRWNPELVDAAITAIVQISDERSRQEIASSGLISRPIPITDIIKYRYQIDIDGNSNSWPGLFQKLLSGSTVLKVTSRYGYRQWYYDRLKPWTHFVPVAWDLSDLIEKVQWVVSNDAEARKIGEQGRALASSMGCDEELDRAVDTIAAAFRLSKNLPERLFSFGPSGLGNKALGFGWKLDEDSALMVGAAALIEIPVPVSRGEYEIELDISPGFTAGVVVSIAVNGENGRLQRIDRRKKLGRLVQMSRWPGAELLSIVLLSPTAHLGSAHFLVEKPAAIRLHSISLRKVASLRVTGEHHNTCQATVMRALHNEDVWRFFTPTGPRTDPIQGWNGIYEPFKRLLAEAPSKIFVDVGAWKGQSTVFVAEIMRKAKTNGCIVAVDTFLGSEEHLNCNDLHLFERLHGRPDLYETFLDNVYYRGLTEFVVPLPQTSVIGAVLLRKRGIKAGIVHLDASREYEGTLRDAEVYWPLLQSGGYLVGDDYHESWPGVVRAAQEFAAKLGLKILIQNPKWIVQKP